VGRRGSLQEHFQMVNVTIVILPKQSPAATDKTVCLVLSSEHYPEGIHKQDVR
jgi:hypothetical protein